jgi:adenine deaminase
MHSVNIKPFNVGDLKLKVKSADCRIIEAVPGQIITRSSRATMPLKDGCVEADVTRDILKLAVVERHHASGRIGLGLISGFGLKRVRWPPLSPMIRIIL